MAYTIKGTGGLLSLGSAFGNISANLVLGGPATGAAATPTFRALVAADLGTWTMSPLFATVYSQDYFVGSTAGQLKFINPGLTAYDAGISRSAAGTLTITSGGSDLGSLQAGNLTATALATPAITAPLTVNGTPGATTYGYKAVAYLNDGSHSAASPEVTIATGNATLDGTNNITVAWPAVTNQAYSKLYRTTGGTGPPRLIYSGTAPSFVDVGAAGTVETPATTNTTGVLTSGTLTANSTAVTSTVPIIVPNGTAAANAISGSTRNTGISLTSGSLLFHIGGVQRGAIYATGTQAITYRDQDYNSFRLTEADDAGFLEFSRGGYLAWSSTATCDGSVDLQLGRADAATLRLGAPSAASPVAQTLTFQGARGGTDTNTAGMVATITGSLGTGTAAAGPISVKTGYPTTTGTTQHVASTRIYAPGTWTALTAETPTAIATLTYGASSVIGGQWLVTVKAADATDMQAVTYVVTVNSIRNSAGNTVSTVAANAPAVAAGTGTLTATFAVTEGAAAATLTCTATSSLTETTLAASWQSLTNGSGLTLAQN